MSTLGQQYAFGNCCKAVCILPSGTVANTANPSLATDGIPTYPPRAVGDPLSLCFPGVAAKVATLQVKASCTAGQVLVGTLTMWGYNSQMNAWIEISVNGGTPITPVALAETDADAITFQQQLNYLGHYERLYLQLTGIGGAGATFEAWLVTSQEIA